MQKENNITKMQHYIPQVYLRGFSPEYLESEKKEIPTARYTIYCYDLKTENQINKAVPIKSVCFCENLYEVIGDNRKIVIPNYLEKIFSKIETNYGKYRHNLEIKAFNKENNKTKCFLTGEEKIFWATYILIQILRIPQILELAAQTALETWGDEINEQQAKNIAKIFCLPFFRKMKEENKEVEIFNTLFKPMEEMSFGVGVDRKGKIITSDKPIYMYTKEFSCKEYEKVIFLISSQICLFLFGGEEKEKSRKNFLFEINDDVREEIVKSMTVTSFQKLYSNHVLDKTELKCVKEVLEHKGSYS